VDTFEERVEFFQRTGLSEEGAKVAAIGRYRTEADARAADAEFEAMDLADELAEQASSRPDRFQQDVADLQAQLQASIPVITENVTRALRGLPPLSPPAVTSASPMLLGTVEQVVPVVREVLRMNESDARGLVERLHQRETRRHGNEHADRFMRTFAEGLRERKQVREVAP